MKTAPEVVSQYVRRSLYNKIPSTIETEFEIIDGNITMIDCAGLSYQFEVKYPNKYIEAQAEDVYWISGFTKHVVKWFWKENPIPEGHTCYILDVRVDPEDYFVYIKWGSR